MFSGALFSGTRIDGSELEPGERVVALAFFGSVELNFVSAPPPPAVELVAIAIFGGVTVNVQPTHPVRLSGFSLFAGRDVEPRRRLPMPSASPPATPSDSDEDFDLPLEITAYALFGGVSVKRPTESEAVADAHSQLSVR